MQRHTRPARALRRVLFAPGFVFALWLLQIGLAKLLAGPSRAAASATMRNWAWFDDGHALRAMIELLGNNTGIVAALGHSLLAATIFAMAFSMFTAPAILARLDGQRSVGWLLAISGRELPAMLVQTCYGLVLRGLGLGLALLSLVGLGARAAPLAIVLAAFPVLVLDRARAAVVLDDQRPFHPMTFLRAIGHVTKHPLWWLCGSLIEALKLGLGAATILLVIAAGPSSAALWVARAAGLAMTLLGLWRISLAVDSRDSSASTE